MDISVPANHTVKLKESGKRDKYLNIVREMKTLRNMKVTFIPMIIDALGTDTKGIIKRVEKLKKGDEWRPSNLLHY